MSSIPIATAAGEAIAPENPASAAAAPAGPKVLIVHDQIDDPQLGQELAALLGHFSAQSTIVEQQFYEAASLQNYDIIFYMGGSHREINPDFLKDVSTTGKTVVWMGRGLDWLGNVYPLKNLGFEYARVDGSGAFNTVTYDNTQLARTNPVTNVTYVTDESRAEVPAWTEGDGDRAPYVIHSGSFWYFADIPMVGTDANSVYSAVGATEDSAYLVLADLLHDITGQDHPSQHAALVRIEDMHPNSDVNRLNSVVDYLYHKQVPFGIALVPVYKNPATGEQVHLSDRPEFVAAIKDAEAKGAVIVMHGYTHQLNGETVVDYEFWDGQTHAPPANETPESVSARVEAGLRETAAVGIYPQIWETPHYAASDMAHSVISRYFNVVWERSDAPFFPYLVTLPKTGQTDLPETLGYVNPTEGFPGQGHSADTLVSVAGQQKVVRDGTAAFFFHPMVDGSQLRKTVEGLQDEGFTFVSPLQMAGLPYTPPDPPSWFSNALWHIDNQVGSLTPDGTLDTKVITLIAFFIIFYYWGMFLLSRKPAPVTDPPDDKLRFVIVVPCLNEELVIGRTLDHLLALPNPNLSILVVDDNSDDRTREIAMSYPRERVTVIDHPPKIARQGKGRVLNYAFRSLMHVASMENRRTDKIVLGVIDADGRVEKNVIDSVNPYFTNPKTGAVQVGVRISNANTNTLTKWQNFEFLTFARISQKAREHLGSVGLGGNGQFVRLSALASLGDDPWTDCLTEDLDLGIRLMLKGWNNRYCPDSFVSQQGVPKMRPLVRQRTRWFQGHITCWRHIPSLLAGKTSTMARTDTIYYLLAPILVFMFLPSSILFIFWSIYFLVSGASTVVLSPLSYIPVLVVWYLFSFGALPTVVWTFWREEKEISAWKAFLWAHVFSFFYVIWFVAGCIAVYRLARGQGSWAKTARTEESFPAH
ncbi:MAG: DUF2334 domain-containing protein [Actinobacteria bacterium]|nr:DUF2334 domain-containing protein [Actinomycetota bacterium]MCL5882662.1 DUF2334 domain-containing protein [Actinomycetota bacterium]